MQVQTFAAEQRTGVYPQNENTIEGGFPQESPKSLSVRPPKGSTTGSAQDGAKGQADIFNWDNLKRLVPGNDIRVVLNDAKACHGRLEIVTDEEIVIRTDMGAQTFTRKSMRQVSAKRDSHRKRNAFIGLLVGAGVGVIVPVASPELGSGRCSVSWPGCVDAAMVTAMGFLGGGVGYGIGALIPTGGWHDVYRAR
jgi:hypothetical protein